MFGVLALVVTVGVCAGIVGVDNYRKQEYESRQSNATKRWEEAYHYFLNNTTNRAIELDLEPKVSEIIYGSKKHPEIIDEIKSTYKQWINTEPYYIKYLGHRGTPSIDVYNNINRTLMTILMANRGYLTTGVVLGGIRYNSVNPPSQGIFLAKRLDEILQKKGIHEELYAKQDMCDPQLLSYNNRLGYTGCIFWKPTEPILYY